MKNEYLQSTANVIKNQKLIVQNSVESNKGNPSMHQSTTIRKNDDKILLGNDNKQISSIGVGCDADGQFLNEPISILPKDK